MHVDTKYVAHFQENKLGRDFVVGDIHGMFATLEKLLTNIQFDPNIDRVFSVGDLIDRGTESGRIVEFLGKPWFFSIMGNHEKMLMDSQDNEIIYLNWIKHNAGEWWKTTPDKQRKKIRSAIEKLPLVIDIETSKGLVGIVHADIPIRSVWQRFIEDIEVNKGLQQHVLWSRARYERYMAIGSSETIEGVLRVICGHTTLTEHTHIGNVYYIDTGAAYINNKDFGHLTLMQIQPTVKYFQTNTKKKKRWFK